MLAAKGPTTSAPLTDRRKGRKGERAGLSHTLPLVYLNLSGTGMIVIGVRGRSEAPSVNPLSINLTKHKDPFSLL